MLQGALHYCSVPRNRWVAGDENTDNALAARKLAQQLRGSFVHPVHHTSQCRQVFKELAKGTAHSALGAKQPNHFRRQFKTLTGKAVHVSNARLTVARALVATLYAM